MTNLSMSVGKGGQGVDPQQALNQRVPGLGSINEVRAEVDSIIAAMHEFSLSEPDEVASSASAHLARLLELKVRVSRIEGRYPTWKSMISKELNPTIDIMSKQWDIASRRQSIREHDWKVSMG